MKIITTNLLSILLPCIYTNVFSTQYFVSSTGNDSNDGTSISKAWLTIDRVRFFAWSPGFTAGDTIFFEGEKIFTTSNGIYLQSDLSKGSASNPIVFTSYGIGKSVLKAKGCHMFQGWAPDNGNVGLGVEISKLIIEGDSISLSGPKNACGIYFWNSSIIELDYLLINDVEIKGFAGNGIETGRDKGKGRFKNILVRNVVAHHNPGAAGISPHTGSGIIIGGTDGALIEHCISHNNGIKNNNPGGPIGIWFWDCTNSIIQYCESYENKTTNGDGGGFDLDGGCNNCIIQYCYSHDNDGAGFLFAQFSGANEYGPLSDNIVRYNISENDGRKGNYCGIYFWGANSTDKVGKNYVYNNTVYMGRVPVNSSPACVCFQGSNMDNVKLWNNIFMSSNTLNLINSNTAFPTSKVIFQNNVYFAEPSTNFNIKWSLNHNSLSDWRKNSNGQEMDGADSLGLQIHPMLIDAGNGGKINNTYALNTLHAYKLQSTSPLIDAAADLKLSPYLLTNTGQFDFYNNNIPVGGKFDYGAYDTTISITTNIILKPKLDNNIIVFPNPNTSESFVIHSQSAIQTVTILNIKGQKTASFQFQNSYEVKISHKFKKGIYFLSVTTLNGTFTNKIIVN